MRLRTQVPLLSINWCKDFSSQHLLSYHRIFQKSEMPKNPFQECVEGGFWLVVLKRNSMPQCFERTFTPWYEECLQLPYCSGFFFNRIVLMGNSDFRAYSSMRPRQDFQSQQSHTGETQKQTVGSSIPGKTWIRVWGVRLDGLLQSRLLSMQ